MESLSAILALQNGPQSGAISALAAQYAEYVDWHKDNTQDKYDQFVNSYLEGDRNTTIRHLSETLDGLFERPTRPDLNFLTMAIASKLGWDILEPDDQINSQNVISLWNRFLLRLYPNINTWQDIQDHPRFKKLTPFSKLLLKDNFNDWQDMVATSKSGIRAFAQNIEILGFDIDKIALGTRCYTHYPDKAEFLTAVSSIVKEDAQAPAPSSNFRMK